MLCAVVLANAAYPASFVYSNQQKRISAGVLTGCWPSGPSPVWDAWVPFMFYIMEQRLDIKPAGWEFYNPLAPSLTIAVDGTITKIDKDMPEYWRVDVSSPLEDLMKMDVLLIPAQTALSFPRLAGNARDKLRKYVDGGGTLIIDNQGSAAFPDGANEFFIDEVQFQSGGAASAPANVPMTAMAHPLVRRPFALNWEDINKLGDGLSPVGARYISDFAGGIPPDPVERHFASIITDNDGNPIVSAAQYGSGHIVVVATGIGRAICEPVGTTGGLCNKMFMAAQPEDLKFAYNIVNWGSEHNTFHKNARHSGYSFAEIGMPLVPMWKYELPAAVATGSSPAILDDMVFYVDGGWILHAFDLTSTMDRDGRNGSDDGFPADSYLDQSNGAPYDEIWRVDLGGPASSPTTGYIPWTGGIAVPAVFVTTQTGDVRAYNALTGDPKTGNPIIDSSAIFLSATDIPAPTYVDGTVYMGDGQGRLWAYNLLTSTGWQSPAAGPPADLCPASGSPVVGCVRDPATGTIDQVVYLARNGVKDITDGTVQSFPIKVFNEVLRRTGGTDPTWTYSTRAGGSQIMGYMIYYVDGGGNLNNFIDAGGTVALPSPSSFQLTFPGSVPPGSAIIADYELNPFPPGAGINARAKTSIKTNVLPGTIPPAGDGIVGTPALGTNDILYFGTSNGSLYAMRETGHGIVPGTVRARIEWRWYLRALLGADAAPSGSPAVARDMVYYAVNSGADGYIMAFENDPSFVLNLGLASGTRINRSKGVKLEQNDSMRPGEVISVNCGTSDNSQATIDYDAGKITINNFRSGSSPVSDLSASQDITVKYYLEGDDANEIQSFHPAFGAVNPNDKWNNLAWYVNLGTMVTSSPMVIGDVLYVGLYTGELAVMDVEKMKAITSQPITWNPGVTDGQWKEQVVLGSADPIYSTVAGSNGILAVSTSKGLVIYHNPVTLVAEGNRLIEYDSSGSLLWSCDATTGYVSSTIAPAAGTIYGAVKVPFNRPSVARRASVGGMIVADTGNDRVVHIDTGGQILWEITSFVDTGPVADLSYPNAPQLPAGSSLSLSRPMDVSMWTQQDTRPGYTSYPEYHYLIADSGNYRVIEVVARCYDTATGAYQNELQWTSMTTAQGKQYRYTSARRVFEPEETAPGSGIYNWVTRTMCVVSNYEVADPSNPSNPEGPGGALIKIDDSIGLPMVRKIEQSGINDSPPGGPVLYKLQNPTFFDRTYISATEYCDIVVDATGLYVTRYDDDPSTSTGDYVRRYTAQDYLIQTAPLNKPLSVSYAQLLPNGNILVANKATGTLSTNAAFFGEVFELRWDSTLCTYVYEALSACPAHQPLSAERVPY